MAVDRDRQDVELLPTEPARTIAAGEDILTRVHDVAESIVGRVRRVLADLGRDPAPPEAVAERFVSFPPGEPPGRENHIQLTAPGCPPVVLGPFTDPTEARERLDSLRQFVAAAVRAAVPPPADPLPGGS